MGYLPAFTLFFLVRARTVYIFSVSGSTRKLFPIYLDLYTRILSTYDHVKALAVESASKLRH